MSELALAAPAESMGSGFWVRFGIPVALALVIHALAVLALIEGWSATDESRFAVQIEALQATLIEIESAVPAPVTETEQVRPAEQRTQPQSETAPVTPQERPEPVTPEAGEESAPVPEPAVPEQPVRRSDFEDDALREMVEESFTSSLDSEAALLAAERADSRTASYVGAIVTRIERTWSRPPSARNGMRAELLIALVPTGELVSVEVVTSSGNAPFDRSAESAVRQAAPFEVPADPELFERQFRQLRILFHPEDLRN